MLSVIGDGPERAPLEHLAESLDVAKHVTFLGSMKHSSVMSTLSASHVFLNHSVVGPNGDEEGIPNVLKEAYLCGLPVVASRHSGIGELVAHMSSGLLVDEGDTRGIAAALHYMYRNPDRRHAFAQAGEARVRSDYDLNYTTHQLSSLYASLFTS